MDSKQCSEWMPAMPAMNSENKVNKFLSFLMLRTGFFCANWQGQTAAGLLRLILSPGHDYD